MEGFLSWDLHGLLALKGLVELHAQLAMDEAHTTSTSTMLVLGRGVTAGP